MASHHFRVQLQNLARHHKPVVTTPFYAPSEYAESAANRDLANTLAQLTNQEVITKSQYGFEGGSDPFSVSQKLNQQYANRQGQTKTGFAAQGQLYSTAKTGQQNLDARHNAEAVDSAQKDYATRLADLAERRATAQNLASDQISQAQINAALAGVQAPLDPLAVYPKKKKKVTPLI